MLPLVRVHAPAPLGSFTGLRIGILGLALPRLVMLRMVLRILLLPVLRSLSQVGVDQDVGSRATLNLICVLVLPARPRVR